MAPRYPTFGPTFDDDISPYSRLGLIASILGHIVLAIVMFSNFGSRLGEFEEPVVYSVSIEGGKRLGGISQLPVKDEKMPLAPPKKTSSEEKKVEEVKPPETKPEVKKEEPPKIPEAETGEVHIEKTPPKKEVPTPVTKKEVPKKPPVDPKAEADKRYQEALQRYQGESSNAGAGNQFGSAALGGTGGGGGTVRPPEFFIYLKKLEQHIKSGWVWNNAAGDLVTQVVFEMSTDGRISAIVITKGSGNRAYDDSVFRAVAKASPAPAPPPVVYEFFRSVRMTFDPRE